MVGMLVSPRARHLSLRGAASLLGAALLLSLSGCPEGGAEAGPDAEIPDGGDAGDAESDAESDAGDPGDATVDVEAD